MIDLSDTVRGYLACALWTSTIDDDDCTPMDRDYRIEDIDPKTVADAVAVCDTFESANGTDIDLYYDSVDMLSDSDAAKDIGCNLWLSRNGHGCGFFDWDTYAGARLQLAAEDLGEVWWYLGDDEKIYQMGCE